MRWLYDALFVWCVGCMIRWLYDSLVVWSVGFMMRWLYDALVIHCVACIGEEDLPHASAPEPWTNPQPASTVYVLIVILLCFQQAAKILTLLTHLSDPARTVGRQYHRCLMGRDYPYTASTCDAIYCRTAPPFILKLVKFWNTIWPPFPRCSSFL
jgi:hypothetical protein